MIARVFIVTALLFTASCGEPPSTDTKAEIDAAAEADEELVAERQKSIEEAAEEATKIIEADAKAEIDAAVSDQPDN